MSVTQPCTFELQNVFSVLKPSFNRLRTLDGNGVFDFMKISFNALCAKHEGLTCLCGAAVRNSWTSLVTFCLRSVQRSYRKPKKSS